MIEVALGPEPRVIGESGISVWLANMYWELSFVEIVWLPRTIGAASLSKESEVENAEADIDSFPMLGVRTMPGKLMLKDATRLCDWIVPIADSTGAVRVDPPVV